MISRKKQSTKHLQIPAAKRSSKSKRSREKTNENNEQEPRGKKPHMEMNTQQQQNETAVKKTNESREYENEHQEKKPNKTENEIQGRITVTIQTREGQYEATLTAETDGNCPLQKIREKLGLTRYKIPQPPIMMHNIPTHYTTKGLFSGKVPKFDIKRPTKDEQLWNKQIEKKKLHTRTHNRIT